MYEERTCKRCTTPFKPIRYNSCYCNKAVTKICPCGKRFSTTCSTIYAATCGCGATKNLKLLFESKYWSMLDPNLNDLSKLTKLSTLSLTVLWWKGKDCEHSWPSPVQQITRYNQTSCQVCSGNKVVAGVNDFATLRPKEALEWDKDNEISANQATEYSNKKVWWNCTKCKFRFETSPNKRSSGHGCPACSGRRLVPGQNDLMTRFPKVAAEWDLQKNSLPADQVMPGTTKLYWWLCPQNHSYQNTPNKRSHGAGCSICFKANRSSTEQLVEKIIREHFPNETIVLSERSVLNGKEIDIYLPRLKRGIEVNGEHWHQNSAMIRRGYKSAHEAHKIKWELAKDKGVQLAFVWDSDLKLDSKSIEQAIVDFVGSGLQHYSLSRLGSRKDLLKQAFFEHESIFDPKRFNVKLDSALII